MSFSSESTGGRRRSPAPPVKEARRTELTKVATALRAALEDPYIFTVHKGELAKMLEEMEDIIAEHGRFKECIDFGEALPKEAR